MRLFETTKPFNRVRKKPQTLQISNPWRAFPITVELAQKAESTAVNHNKSHNEKAYYSKTCSSAPS